MNGANTRVVAANVLDAVMHRGRSLKAELANALPKLPDPRDRALVEAAVMAALREHGRYADVLTQWMARPPAARDGLLRSLIYIGLAQIDAMKLSPHAAVDATVEAARLSGRAHQSGLVNALLRRALREPLPAVRIDAAWPEWLASRVRSAWPDDAEAIFVASAETPPMWLRVNRQRIPRGLYAERLTEVGMAHHLSDDLEDAIRMDTPLPVHALPGFDEGQLSVQDGSAQRLVDALDLLPKGAKVLDACAAPGGKVAHLAERRPDTHQLAIDVDERRVRRMQEGFARLGLEIATGVADATSPNSVPANGGFDAIVIDAPCSATGIVRRQPDILLHRREDDIDALIGLQIRLLESSWTMLKPGGTLLYATCSILPEENSRNVSDFIARHADAELQPLDARFGRDTGHGHQRLPGEGGMDGFFYASIKKRS